MALYSSRSSTCLSIELEIRKQYVYSLMVSMNRNRKTFKMQIVQYDTLICNVKDKEFDLLLFSGSKDFGAKEHLHCSQCCC